MGRRIARLGMAGVAIGTLVVAGVTAAAPVEQAAADGPSVHFTAAGDYAASTNAQAVLSKIGEIDPDLNLALGDLSYGVTGTEQSWCDLVTQRVGAGFPFELIAGNHESNGINGNINDFAACLPNQVPGLVGTYARQSYVDVPAQNPVVRFITISPAITFPNGTDQYTVGSPRYAWTAAAIDGARAASIPWVVVGMHKPCLSLGEYGCDPGADLLNLLISKRVDLVLTGHEHLYQRTKQLALGTGCSAVTPGSVDTDCIVDGDADLVKGLGTVFATVGTGGIAQRAVDPADAEAPYFAAASGLDTATWGVLDVQATATTLTASFQRASGGTFADAFTIGPSNTPQNQPPTAAFAVSCTRLDCVADAAASTDADGTIASYTWDFGDGTTGTGWNVSHHYLNAGTYAMTLTVTDDDGALASLTRTVSPTAPGEPFAADTFTRTTTNGFGNAETGGAWRLGGSAANYAVSGGTGRITFPTAGAGPDVALPATSVWSTDLTFSLATDKPMTGGGLYVYVGARRVGGVGEYRAKLRLNANGTVTLGLARTAGSTETALAPVAAVPGLTYAVGDRLQVRMQVTGTSPTTIQARVWKAGTLEPGTWQVSRLDSTAGLQAAGSVGLNFYLSSSTTNAPLTVLVDDLAARVP